jgi:hypothetical protein
MREVNLFFENYCMYCGEMLKTGYDDNQKYEYCDCEDVVIIEKIDNEIRKLELSKPKKKYQYTNKTYIGNIK